MKTSSTSTSTITSMSIKFILFTLVALISIVFSHGFMSYPPPRMYSDINIAIDNLRSPDSSRLFCRGITQGEERTSIKLNPGSEFTVTLSISNGAEHQGYCGLELYDSLGNLEFVLAQNLYGCGIIDDSIECVEPPGLITGDMCTTSMTITVPENLVLSDSNGFLRWTWVATHVDPPEYYEVCSDVKIVSGKCTTTVKTK